LHKITVEKRSRRRQLCTVQIHAADQEVEAVVATEAAVAPLPDLDAAIRSHIARA